MHMRRGSLSSEVRSCNYCKALIGCYYLLRVCGVTTDLRCYYLSTFLQCTVQVAYGISHSANFQFGMFITNNTSPVLITLVLRLGVKGPSAIWHRLFVTSLGYGVGTK